MLKFTLYNANPKNRKTCDCSTRALAGALGISYEEALQRQVAWAAKKYYAPHSHQITELVLKDFGYIKMKQPRKADGRKYKVGELDRILTPKQMQAGVFVTIANHDTSVKDGAVIDTWDCREKTVGNYFIKA